METDPSIKEKPPDNILIPNTESIGEQLSDTSKTTRITQRRFTRSSDRDSSKKIRLGDNNAEEILLETAEKSYTRKNIIKIINNYENIIKMNADQQQKIDQLTELINSQNEKTNQINKQHDVQLQQIRNDMKQFKATQPTTIASIDIDSDAMDYVENSQTQTSTYTAATPTPETATIAGVTATTTSNTQGKVLNNSSQYSIYNPIATTSQVNNKITISKPLVLKNKHILNNNIQNNDSADKAESKIKKNKDVPDIVVYEIQNHKELLTHLKTLLGNDHITLRPINKDKTAICTYNLTDRNKIKEFLSDNSARYFTHTPKQEKPISCLIKYVNNSFDETDIREDIAKLKLDLNIIQLKKLPSQTQTSRGNSVWFIQFTNNSNYKPLLGKQKICSTVVHIEIYKSKTLTQCKRCQRYSHTAVNCNQEYRCVKCGKSRNELNENNEVVGHEPNNCPLNLLKINGKTDTNKLFCCNCKKFGHPANHRKCEKFLELMERHNQKSNLYKQSQSNRQTLSNSMVQQGISFADQVKNSNNQTNRSRSITRNDRNTSTLSATRNRSNSRTQSQSNGRGSNFSFINEQCNTYFGDNFHNLINKVNQFVPNFKKLKEEQKRMKLLEFLIEISPTNDQ